MYTHPDSHYNRFKLVKIPSAKDLAEQLKSKEPIGHNDMTDEIPENLNGMDNLDIIAAGGSILNGIAVDSEFNEVKVPEEQNESSEEENHEDIPS